MTPAATPTDIELMLRVQTGDERAFAVLYDRYHRKLLDFFFALGRNGHVAEDLCQETFLRIWRLRRRYAATGSFPAYLFTFGRNIWLEKCREFKKLQRLGVRQGGLEWQAAIAGHSSDRPDVRAARSELEAHIVAALDRLPEAQRMAFVLRHVDGLSIDEISAVMDCPANTVRSRKILAVKKLRHALNGVRALYDAVS